MGVTDFNVLETSGFFRGGPMHSGKLVFAQLMEHLPLATFRRCVARYPGKYPRTFDEMDEWFRTEAQCRHSLQQLCWPNGLVCERCGAVGEPWVTARGVFRCKECDGSTSLTAGTVSFWENQPQSRMATLKYHKNRHLYDITVEPGACKHLPLGRN